MNKFLIIDGLNIVRRMHAAQPNEQDTTGLDTRVLSACQKLLKFHQPTHAAIVWDGDAISWRKKLYEDYKKGRKPMPQALSTALPQIKALLDEHHLKSIEAEAEADDVIATLATKLVNTAGEAVIVSTDKGFTQLLHPSISRWDYFNQCPITIEEQENKLSVHRSQFIDYLALAGDSGNKIPGINGIGPKSAAQLLKTFSSLSALYKSLHTLGAKQAKKLEEGRDMARLSYKLVQLQTQLPLRLHLSQFRLPTKA